MEWRRWRRSYSVIFFCCSLLSLFYLTALLSSHHSCSHKGVDSLMMESYSQSQVARTSPRRRRVALAGGGPGSYPPQCAGKCGACAPCRPVHVAVPPGWSSSPVTTEYYPEAWRCKCGNKLYMP
ncbi:uncharacterized protein LOC141815654 [Curcuma longa]|uniref:uncharacterized protein LOC141815654 n=1 Tax=Curcuma longa TaxID=136217 RepID=UPI003D9EBBDB